jgi:molybdopterin-guanine dinucleotide biosynthesis protein A
MYRRSFAEVAERSLRAGKNKIDSLFAEVHTRIIDPEELTRNRFQQEMFHNLNTEQEWTAAQTRLPPM